MDAEGIRDLAIYNDNVPSFYNGEIFPNTIWKGWVENLKVYFIEPYHPGHFFHRGCFYGCEDETELLYFSRAALEFMLKEGLHPDIIHLHDWQTAAIAAFILRHLSIHRDLKLPKLSLPSTTSNIKAVVPQQI